MIDHAARLRSLNDQLLTSGLDVSDVVLDAASELDRRRDMIFRLAHKLNAVLGLNAQELKWMESLGATIERETPSLFDNQGCRNV